MVEQKWNLNSCPPMTPPDAKVIVWVAWSAATLVDKTRARCTNLKGET